MKVTAKAGPLAPIAAPKKKSRAKLTLAKRIELPSPIRTLNASRITDTKVVREFSKALADRAWMLDFASGGFIELSGEFNASTAEQWADFAETDPAVSADVTGIWSSENRKEDVVMLVLYPSGAVRSLSGAIRQTSTRATLTLEDPLDLLDPDVKVDSIPEEGLPFSLKVAALRDLPDA